MPQFRNITLPRAPGAELRASGAGLLTWAASSSMGVWWSLVYIGFLYCICCENPSPASLHIDCLVYIYICIYIFIHTYVLYIYVLYTYYLLHMYPHFIVIYRVYEFSFSSFYGAPLCPAPWNLSQLQRSPSPPGDREALPGHDLRPWPCSNNWKPQGNGDLTKNNDDKWGYYGIKSWFLWIFDS